MARNRYGYRSSLKPRSIRRIERKNKKNLIRSLFLSGLVLFIFFFWGLPFLITKLSVVNKSKISPAESKKDYVELAPPVLNIPIEATNSSRLQVKGFGSPKSKVQIFSNNELKITIDVLDDGSFLGSFELSQGENFIYGKTVDDKGQLSLGSKTIRLIFSEEKPSLEIFEPEDNKQVQGGDKKITVKGKTDPSNSLTINGNIVIVGFDGNFETSLGLLDGDNPISIQVTNSFGNSTTITRKVIYTS